MNSVRPHVGVAVDVSVNACAIVHENNISHLYQIQEKRSTYILTLIKY